MDRPNHIEDYLCTVAFTTRTVVWIYNPDNKIYANLILLVAFYDGGSKLQL